MNQQAFFLQSQWQDKLPKKSMPLITQSLEKDCDEKKINTLSLIALKNPITGLVLHWLIGFLGAGRFYKGNPICGVIQIILSICIIICLFAAWEIVEEMDDFPYPKYSEYVNIDEYREAVTKYDELRKENIGGLIFCVFLVIGWSIYMIVEYFLIYRGIKEDNLNKILPYLR